VAGSGAIYYALADADGFPALMELPPGGAPRRIAWRANGNRTSVRGDWIVFDQLERARSVALYSDLYAVRAGGGPVRRLTKDARAGDPDLSPDGRRIVCTVQATGRRALALLDFSPSSRTSTPRVLIDDPEADYTGPRWSPDGRQIVAERRRRAVYELVLIDPGSGAVRALVSRADARLVTPSWTPDGATILFSADFGDEPFNVFAVVVGTGAITKVTDTAGGAQFPELSPDGALTYVGYTPDGYDLFSVETFRLKAEATREEGTAEATREEWTAEADVKRVAAAGDSRGFRLQAEDPKTENVKDERYRPGRTLVPTFWTPIVISDAGETVVGAATAMFDALGRHAYAVDAGWSGARTRPDWHAAYAYDRWRPTLFASYSDDTDPTSGGTVRSRELFAGALLPFRHLRWTETLLAGFDAQIDTLSCRTINSECRTPDGRRDLRSLRGGWRHDSRRLFGYSISPEEGFAVEAAAEASRTVLGRTSMPAPPCRHPRLPTRVRAPQCSRGFARRGGRVGAAFGGRRLFSAGGSGPSYLAFDFGRDTIGLLRGVAPEDVLGTRAAVANLDFRFPLARFQRGAGTWPIFFRALHGAAFVDAGEAWDSTFRAADLRTSTGAVSLDLVVSTTCR
jgi:Tol biopolymer transport system component